ncbi:MAG: TIGR01212 family radical SAM protein [Clostridia bacterium]|nr:TIGR01212 family radical SAM protein [Clostridia bacterium]
MKLYTFNDYCIQHFGEKLYKLSLDGGFSCPTRISREEGGCAFCAGGSGYFAAAGSIEQQLAVAKAQVAAKFKGERYIAYFQSYTNTYAPLEQLRALYLPILERKEIAALAIGTRPDCLSEEVVSFLGTLAAKKPLFIELGLQTANDQTAEAFGRGYPTSRFFEAVETLHRYPNIHVVAHLMIGLPNEGEKELLESVDAINRAGVDGVKFHLLHILKGTPYEALYRAGKISTLSIEQYGDLLIAALRALKPNTVVHRITGDGAKALLIAPLWSGNKKKVLNYLNKRIKEA